MIKFLPGFISGVKGWLVLVLAVATVTAIVYQVDRNLAIPGLLVATLTAVFLYFYSGRIILAITNARELNREDDPKFFALLDNSPYKVYLTDDSQPDCFWLPGAMVISTGARQQLTKAELEVVLAHLQAHLNGVRSEFEADHWAAEQTGDPESLISALAKITESQSLYPPMSHRIEALKRL